MSDSTHSTAIPNEALADASAAVTLPESTSAQKFDPSDAVATEPNSSPPVLDDDHAKRHLAPPHPLAPNGAALTHQIDDDNDSEAETLISSPVKKREALKKANESTSARGVAHNVPIKKDAQRASDEDVDSNKDNVRDSGVDKDNVSRDNAEEQEVKHVKEEETIQSANKPEQEGQGDESDGLSDVLSVRSSFAGSDAQRLTPVNEDESEKSQDESDGDGAELNDRMTNPRKRKHRDSYMQANMEPPRRRRRASDEGQAHAVGENGDSLSPQLRRHRRTISTQSNWTEPNRSVSGGSGVAGSTSSRQRRAATHFALPDAKPTKNNWDSDTSSETSQQHHFNRLTRNINRSVSTPGRPMGRDHKRHVNKYGFTRLAEACENGDLDMVKEWRVKDPEQLEQREFAGNTPLQVASLNGYPEIVSYLLEEQCNPHTANTDQDTPLIDAVENGHIEVVQLLLKAGVDPLRQNLKGQQALDVVDEDTENAQEIRAALREAIEEWKSNDKGQQLQKEEDPVLRPGPSKELHFMAFTSSNLLRLAGENDQSGILEMLQAQVQVTNEIVAAAAKTGDTFTVSMLLAEMKPKDAKKRPELPLLAVIGTSHFEMVKYLTGADGFNPTWRSRSNGMTWFELAEQRQGTNWQQEKELLKQLYDDRTKSERLSSSPVSRRENGKRRRSPLRQLDSDVDMDDLDMNEQARSRRRLVSKKVMREASRGRRSFSSSTSDNDRAKPTDTSKAEHRENSNFKPPLARKVGRPRKTSAPSQLYESRSKRRRSSSIREHLPPFDTPRVDALPESSSEEERKIKVEELERQRIEAEALAEAEAEASRKAELEAKALAERLEEERRQAEQKKKEDEEARRKEAERKAEEIRLQHQRRMAEERRIKEEQQIQALPSALRHVLGLTAGAKGDRHKYIQRHFLPVQVVKRFDLEPTTLEKGKQDELWMLNYQAAAMLSRADAATLLDLPQDPSTKPSAMSEVVTIGTTQEHRRAMLACLQSSCLVHTLPSEDEDLPMDDLTAELAMAEKARVQIAEDRSKFLAMQPLRWIRFSDFYNAATTSSSTGPPLSGLLDLDIRFDCCLDPTPFLADVKVEKSDNGHRHHTPANGTKANGSSSLSLGEEAWSLKGILTTNECNAAVHRAGPGITTFTIVQD